jgi:hypothetical protein
MAIWAISQCLANSGSGKVHYSYSVGEDGNGFEKASETERFLNRWNRCSVSAPPDRAATHRAEGTPLRTLLDYAARANL